MVSVVIAVLSSVFSALIAIASTVAIEKLGGTMGGVLATTPTTIMPFTFGLALTGASYEDIAESMFSVPVGICLTSVYLLLWREVPRLSLVSRLSSSWYQLALVLPLLLAFWMGGAVLIVVALPALKERGVPYVLTGMAFLVLSFTLGVTAMFVRDVPAPTGKRPVTFLQYCSRGLVAGCAIGLSLVISSVSPVAGGVASVFPSITTTTMVTLWLQQGRQVPAGAAGPMMLGNVAVSSFCVLLAVLYPLMDMAGVPLPLTLSALCLLCYVLSTTFVSIPIFALLQWRKGKVHQQKVEAGQVGEEEEEGEEVGEGERRAIAGKEVEEGRSPLVPPSTISEGGRSFDGGGAAQHHKEVEVEELKQPLTAA